MQVEFSYPAKRTILCRTWGGFNANECAYSSIDLPARKLHAPRLFALAIGILFALIATQAAVSCSVSTANLNFGLYDDKYRYSTIGIVVACNGRRINGITSIALSSGGQLRGKTRMNSGAQTIQYNLFTSAAFTSVWGDGTSTHR
jgi:spore coat protein U-like protein